MPRTLHTGVTRHKYNRKFIPIYAATLLLIFHSFLVAYINSSFLQQYIAESSVGAIYTIGAALSVLIFLFASRVLHLVGNYKMTLFLLLVNFVAVVGMALSESLRVAVPLFIVHIISVPLIIFNLDVYMEALIGNNESSTGGRRGLLLALSSIIGAVSPFLSSVLVDASGGSFTNAYLLSAVALLPIIVIIIWFFKDFSDPPYTEIKVFSAIQRFWINKNIRLVFLAHFTLQMFFMFAVVYIPLYLTGYVGLSWAEFGIIMFFAQMAYVLFEYPVGVLADKYLGEKEMMALGLLIIALSVAAMGYVHTDAVWLWALLMFITRIGASFTEVTTESYFFK